MLWLALIWIGAAVGAIWNGLRWRIGGLVPFDAIVHGAILGALVGAALAAIWKLWGVS